ncbi:MULTISPECIES: SIS domain-containing protein [Prochlorococcus]|uniref:Phosphoheptose isomerase n=1 Tax=Prochlorococcus marinus (strain SARG / CCMP1375 / SS120) TaxID=167539 RepID=Q7VAY2_PROMA|nr:MULTISPECIES: SIS domain-containing protein [Prochlorococcus]AAQ00365.1 Phosphoheptose isomerase [Prochlorococcus marinus subsp. marinus str. CCMP1375]KGG14245.1 Phosphoheptose isomerase 1 [Prochlorococcus marinus str. LG]KGG22182.1 Phosphoheptose isomerase 1 [Prochlorococcus marinus str. SS2]KGG24500.1 Phosphoheptose isomerase 1 [Prochlorococcus marinus str. SS35]KGG33395.1 Phosphoheptose isomerase 1 [Prochlorococcus marinus str. SS51]
MPISFNDFTNQYLDELRSVFTEGIILSIKELANDLEHAWNSGKRAYICGNGGSAGNAMHIANDFHYGLGSYSKPSRPGMRLIALPSNPSIVTCLANDIGYENIYCHQLKVLAEKDDLLIVLSGSGNSQNVVKALEYSKEINMKSHAVIAFSGGKCKDIADKVIHLQTNDMQIAEDSQVIIFHMCMQWIVQKSLASK